MKNKILYEDKYLILCEKRVGENSQLSDGKITESLPDKLSKYRQSKGEDSYIGIVHRLDVTTGGVMLFSKDKTLTGKLSEAVSQKEYKKTYLAVSLSRPEPYVGRMDDLLYHDKQKNKTYVVDRERRSVKPASLLYETLESCKTADGNMVSLMRIELMTGRTHQIRAQFASRKMPLVGDGKYGSRDNKCGVALWSHKAEFIHPKTGKTIEVVSFPNIDRYPWNLFDCLRRGDKFPKS